ncbi:MAG: hypothetical protein ACOCV1_07695 [Bacillota bacterium]
MIKGKRGQVKTISQVIGVIFILFVLSVVIVTVSNYTQDRSLPSAVSAGISTVSNFVLEVTGPLFNGLLGLGSDSNTNFLMIITFILISIIIVGTLDSVNLFGEDKQGGLINLAIGIIVSIIGVRFMPQDIWGSLTAPSSAFVATILVAIPFFALFFVTMKVKYPLARKLMWLFYILFMSYLIFFPANLQQGSTTGMFSGENPFAWIYTIFLLGAIFIMFFDSTVRRYILKEKYNYQATKMLSVLDIKKRSEIRNNIEEWTRVINDPSASPEDKKEARKRLKELKDLYSEDLASI